MLDAGTRVHRRQLCAPEGEDHAHEIRFKLQRFEEERHLHLGHEEQLGQEQQLQQKLRQEEITASLRRGTSRG